MTAKTTTAPTMTPATNIVMRRSAYGERIACWQLCNLRRGHALTASKCNAKFSSVLLGVVQRATLMAGPRTCSPFYPGVSTLLSSLKENHNAYVLWLADCHCHDWLFIPSRQGR